MLRLFKSDNKVRFVIDLDGTVSDFTGAAIAHHGGRLEPSAVVWDFPVQLGFKSASDEEFWKPFGSQFWGELEELADGMLAYRVLRRQYPDADFCVCTASPRINRGEAIEGKEYWVRRHLDQVDSRRSYRPLAVVHTDQKWRLASPTSILVDDRTENVNDFRLAGGMAVLVPRPWNVRRTECDEHGGFDVLALLNEIARYADGDAVRGEGDDAQ